MYVTPPLRGILIAVVVTVKFPCQQVTPLLQRNLLAAQRAVVIGC